MMAIFANLIGRLSLDSTAFDRNSKRAVNSMRSMQRQSLALKRGIINLAGAYLGVRGLTRAARSVVSAFLQQERAELDLQAALRNTGSEIAQNMHSFKDYAAELQKLTIYGDEQILSQMAYARNLGVSTDRLKDATKAAIGLAARFRLDLASAMMLVGRASSGQTQLLTRYGIVLDQAMTDQEKFNELLRIGAGAFGLAEDAARTSTGSIDQMKNALGDVAEQIGFLISPTLTDLAVGLKMGAEHIGEIADAARDSKTALEEYKRLTDDIAAGMQKVKYIGGMPIQVQKPAQYPNILAHLRRQQEEGLPMGLDKPIRPEYQMPKATQQILEMGREEIEIRKKITETIGSHMAAVQREIDINKRLGEEKWYATKMIDFENALRKSSITGTERLTAVTESYRQKLDELQQSMRTQKESTVDMAAAYRRMFNDMNEKTQESWDIRKRLLMDEYETYKKVIEDKILLSKWFAEQQQKFTREQAMIMGKPVEAISAKIQDMALELQTLPEMLGDLTEKGLNGLVGGLTDAVFEAKNLNEAMREVGLSMAKMAMQWAMQQAVFGGLSALTGMALVKHGGGTVGGGMQVKRSLPGAEFIGAQRFHGGGEVPAWLQTGERVQSRQQVAGGDKMMGRMVALLERIAAKDTAPTVAVVQSEEQILDVMRSRAGEEAISRAKQRME